MNRGERELGRGPGVELGPSSQIPFRPWVLSTVRQQMIWQDTLMIPTYFVGLSVLALLFHVVASSRSYRSLRAKLSGVEYSDDEDPIDDTSVASTTTISSEIHAHVAYHGGVVIFAHKLLRLLGCLALLCLSIFTAIEDELYPTTRFMTFIKGKKNGSEPVLTRDEVLALAMCMFYFYVSLLGVVSVSAKSKWGRRSWNHISSLLLVTFAVYIYRDIFPFITYTMTPLDSREGWVLWSKVTILTIVSVIIPLVIPQQYVAIDPKDPAETPHPEQTASYFSYITYSYLSNFIWSSQNRPKITQDDLYPLCDYDHASYLRARSFPVLDRFSGAQRRHLFFGLIKVFAWDYTLLGLAILAQVVVEFGSPLGINQILKHVETGGKGAFIQPWFWILILLIGPILQTCTNQFYLYIACRVLAQAQAIITQLVFEHALRIRVKAEATTSTEQEPIAALTVPVVLNPSDSGTEHGIDQETLIESTVHSREETLHGDSSASQGAASTPEPTKGSNTPKSARKVTEDPHETEDKAANFAGKLNNLVTTDTRNITNARDILMVVLQVPVQVTLCIVFLYTILGWSAFVGLAVTIILFPLPGYLANKIQAIRVQMLKRTDARVQTVTETMTIIRMVKLFGWERKMCDTLAEKREMELRWVKKRNYVEVLTSCVNGNDGRNICNITVIMKEELSPSKVFSSMAVFDMLRSLLWQTFYTAMELLAGKVSLDRMSDFLHNTELLDKYTKKPLELPSFGDTPVHQDQIGFKDASFAWTSGSTDGALTPSRRDFRLGIEGELTFKRGCINLILGPTGSGKTSLLMALLGEMHFIPTGPQSWFHLPREGGVAYAAQESWVQNETIRDNIIFGSPFDETRYRKVLHQCALEQDLQLFHAGDQTEVGEKGLTLSGGQKARVTLARAIYSQAKIILLDDVLAALDVHTARWIIGRCLSGDLVEGRTVILVTHNIAMTRNIAGYAVTLDVNGRVNDAGSILDTLANVPSLKLEGLTESKDVDTEDVTSTTIKEPSSSGKLIVDEEVEVGHVSWKAFGLFIKALGGSFPLLYFASYIGTAFLVEGVLSLQTWYLGFWASQYQDHSSVDTFYYLSRYGVLLSICVVLNAVGSLIFVYGRIRASRSIHRQLVDAVLGTTLRWLDTTPISRIIARCTQDIGSIDDSVPNLSSYLISITIAMIVKLTSIFLFTPLFVVPASIIGVLGRWLGQIYIVAQLPVKRELSNAKAPVLAHVGAAMAGIVSIRAYGAQERFLQESLTRINRYTRAQRCYYDLNRWVTVRIDSLGAAFAAALAAWLVYGRGNTANSTGFSLNMAISFSGMILWWVRMLNMVEVEGNSLERIGRYLEADQEPKPTPEGVPPAYWPASGELRVENLSARYSLDGPKVLHDVSFTVESGQRIGVVGRTGSGKSTLTLSLLRGIYTEGDVYYDGIKTNTINLDALRSKITIIPQMPELISGTLRQNLDPFEQFDDAVLNDALRAAGLFSLQSELDENRLTLDSTIASAGGNLSVGQRQVLALARAIVRGSKLLILDEATSAIDYKTDAVIQSTLRTELKDITLIIIAHRLQTIMDADKILVLDAGHIVEFDTPKNLLANEKGKLRALVDESADRETLYAMAGAN